MNKSGMSVSSRAFNEHCKFPSPLYFCNKITVSREGPHYPPRSLGWIKWGSGELLTHKAQERQARRRPVLLEAPEPLRGVSLLQPPGKSWGTPATSFLECWAAHWPPLGLLTPAEGEEAGQTQPPCEPGRTSMLSTSAMEGTLSITFPENWDLSLDVTSSGQLSPSHGQAWVKSPSTRLCLLWHHAFVTGYWNRLSPCLPPFPVHSVKAMIIFLWDDLCFLKDPYVEILTPSTSECDHI